jgi:hypothetical protein
MALTGGSQLAVREGRRKRKLGCSGCLAGFGPGTAQLGLCPSSFFFFVLIPFSYFLISCFRF